MWNDEKTWNVRLLISILGVTGVIVLLGIIFYDDFSEEIQPILSLILIMPFLLFIVLFIELLSRAYSSIRNIDIKNFSIEKGAKIAIIIGIIVVSLSIGYYFVLMPYQQKTITKKCHQQANESYDYEKNFERCLNGHGL
ncbi:MAG: hypothetical protein EOM19_06855 [Candidatus Moranbacteria bacterium]|nr:hypothetical protein [Candidatus Moranbacteria bacterium]